MLECISNYEDSAKSLYPRIYIDWITPSEIKYLSEKYSALDNALDIISQHNVGTDYADNTSLGSDETSDGDKDSWSISDLITENDYESEVDNDFGNDLSTAFNDLFDDTENSGSFENTLDSGFGNDFDNLFGDDEASLSNKNNDLDSEDDKMFDELMDIVSGLDSENTEESSSETVVDIFENKNIPVYVGDELIAHIGLGIKSLRDLNKFFKRNWILEYSEFEKEELNSSFIVKNILRF